MGNHGLVALPAAQPRLCTSRFHRPLPAGWVADIPATIRRVRLPAYLSDVTQERSPALAGSQGDDVGTASSRDVLQQTYEATDGILSALQ